MALLTAAVIGLGQAGSRFDEEPRKAVWSHVGAYLASADLYRLTGGADVNGGNRERFATRCPDVPVFADPVEMMTAIRPDVVSLCTPPGGRAALVEAMLAAHRPRILVCEKPMEIGAEERRRLVETCGQAGVALLVHYNRRYAEIFRRARALVAEGALGTLTSATILAPNRLWSIGSHAVNLLLYLTGETPEAMTSLELPALAEGEPAFDFLCRFPSGAAGRVITAGKKATLVFEADLIGDKARVRIIDNGGRLVVSRFQDSDQFAGYRLPLPEETVFETDPGDSGFLAIIREAAAVAGGQLNGRSTGADALMSEAILDSIMDNSQRISP